MSECVRDLSKAVRSIRKRLGLNMTAFAERIGAGQSTVSRYESGKMLPSRSVLMLLLGHAEGDEREPILRELGLKEENVEGLTPTEISSAIERFEAFAQAPGHSGRPGTKSLQQEFAMLANQIVASPDAPSDALNQVLRHWIRWGTTEDGHEVFENAVLYMDVEFTALANRAKNQAHPRRQRGAPRPRRANS